jgi:serine/threonine protein kinase
MAAYLEAVAAGARPDRERLLPAIRAGRVLTEHDRLAELGRWRAAGVASTATWKPDATRPAVDVASPYQASLPDLPGYEIRREIARGGMGVVYEARQASLNRPVAVKVILHGALASESDRRRFMAEATAAAQLRHPNIVVVHEIGEHAGQPFFSMEYVAGESLARIAQRQLPTPKQAAHYVAEVARAVQFAHDHGVLHRDIKPSNVLIDESGRVRVMDFGLAKHIDADDKLTVTGQMLGTPSYMAPEQITGPAQAVGPACDVYGLGALLYVLLTGQPPFCGAGAVGTLLDALELDPKLPRKLNPQVSRPLEMIALKCLEKNPADRYPSAGAVATDLERFIEGETLSISSPNLLERLVRTLERSQFDHKIRLVSQMLWHVAWIALAAHVLVFMNYATQSTHPLAGTTTIRLLGVAAIGLVFWRRRKVWYPPRGAPARQLAAIWVGYLVGAAALVVVEYMETRLTPPMEARATRRWPCWQAWRS